MKNLLILFLFILATVPVYAVSDYEEPKADMLREHLKSDAFSLGILIQATGAFSLEDTDFNGGRSWDLGSTRIDFRGTVDRDFTYRVRVYFLSQQQNIDARVGYRFSENFRIIAGAFKPYLSKELDPSPANLDFVNRARLVGAMMNTLEVGFSALGSYENLNYRFGIYNGSGVSGIAAQNDNRFLYTSRLSYLLQITDGHELEIGVNGAYNGSLDEDVGNTGLVSDGGRMTYGGFVEYDSDLFFGTIEYLQSRFDAVNFDLREEKINGMYATMGVVMNDRNEILVRWDHLDFNLNKAGSERILVGWNYFPTSLVSFRFNALADFNSTDNTQFGLNGVFQYHF